MTLSGLTLAHESYQAHNCNLRFKHAEGACLKKRNARIPLPGVQSYARWTIMGNDDLGKRDLGSKNSSSQSKIYKMHVRVRIPMEFHAVLDPKSC